MGRSRARRRQQQQQNTSISQRIQQQRQKNNAIPIGQRAVQNGQPVLWAGEHFGWQSEASYNQLEQAGEFKLGSIKLRGLGNAIQQVTPQPVKNAVGNYASRMAAQQQQRTAEAQQIKNPILRERLAPSGNSVSDRSMRWLSDTTNVNQGILETGIGLVEGLVEGKIGLDTAVEALVSPRRSRSIVQRLPGRSVGAAATPPTNTTPPIRLTPDAQQQQAQAIRNAQNQRRLLTGQSDRTIPRRSRQTPEVSISNAAPSPTPSVKPASIRERVSRYGSRQGNQVRPEIAVPKPSAPSITERTAQQTLPTNRRGVRGTEGSKGAPSYVSDPEGIGTDPTYLGKGKIQGPVTSDIAQQRRQGDISKRLATRKRRQRASDTTRQITKDNRETIKEVFQGKQGPLSKADSQRLAALQDQLESIKGTAKDGSYEMNMLNQMSDSRKSYPNQKDGDKTRLTNKLRDVLSGDRAAKESRRSINERARLAKRNEYDDLRRQANTSGEAKQKLEDMGGTRSKRGELPFKHKKRMPGQDPIGKGDRQLVADHYDIDVSDVTDELVYEFNATRTTDNWMERTRFQGSMDPDELDELRNDWFSLPKDVKKAITNDIGEDSVKEIYGLDNPFDPGNDLVNNSHLASIRKRRIESLKGRPTSPVKWRKPKQRQDGPTEMPSIPTDSRAVRGKPANRGERKSISEMLKDAKDNDLDLPNDWDPRKVGKEEAIRNVIKSLEDKAQKIDPKNPQRRVKGAGRMSKGGKLNRDTRTGRLDANHEARLRMFKNDIESLADELGITDKMVDNISESDKRLAVLLGFDDHKEALVYKKLSSLAKAEIDGLSPDNVSFVDSAKLQDRLVEYRRAKGRKIVENYEDELGHLSTGEYQEIYGSRDSKQRITGGRLKTDNDAGKESARIQFREQRARRGAGDTRHRPRKNDSIRKRLAGKALQPSDAMSVSGNKPSPSRTARRFDTTQGTPNRTVPIGETVLDRGDGLNQRKPKRGGRISQRVQRRRRR